MLSKIYMNDKHNHYLNQRLNGKPSKIGKITGILKEIRNTNHM